MGANYSKTEPEMPIVGDLYPNNGLVFNDWFLPPEVVAHILSYLEPILNGRRVCRCWRDIIDTVVWREKVLREVPGATASLFQHKELDWRDYYHLWKGKPHKKNLLKNGSAEAHLKHWSADPARWTGGGSKWIVEKKPVGCDPFPAEAKSCFVTSYDWCSSDQVINLGDYGLTPAFMKHVRPNIHIEEWYGGRHDCGFKYVLKVSLLTHRFEVKDSFLFEKTGHTAAWAKVEHVFSNYDGEIANINFHHKGKDTQFWAGHYGSKMTGAKVYITLPACDNRNS